MTFAELKTYEVPNQSIQLFRSILVATDFSEASRRALASALSLAKGSDAHISVVHVFQTDWRYEMLESPPEIDLERSDAQEKLDAEVRGFRSERRIDSILIRQRSVAQAVLSAAAQSEADLLVLGTHGRTGLLKIALGSVAEELLRAALCPVMTIGPKVNAASSKNFSGFQSILFATDFGPGSSLALPFVAKLAQQHKSKLILLHMIAPMPSTSASLSAYAPSTSTADELQEWEGSLRKRSLGQLQEWVRAQQVLKLEPHYVVGVDLLPEGILTAARQFKADLIVMGANRVTSGRWIAHLPWTAVYRVIHDAKCPVITVAG